MAVPIKMLACVNDIIKYTDDVYQVVFEPEKQLPLFKAGQFLSLALDDYNPCGGRWPESRAFSLACSNKKNTIIIVYSVKGMFTQRMRSELCVDKKVWVSLPLGSCIINVHDNTQEQDIVLVAAGTGIAPYIPYLEEELEKPSGRKILLAYGIRGEHCFLFKELLRDCCQKLPNFELMLFTAQNINFEHVIKQAGLMDTPRFFISGPPSMIQSLQELLFARGVTENRIHIDNWG